MARLSPVSNTGLAPVSLVAAEIAAAASGRS
ncbi:Uncharacterised protein [Mycobacterium tuberculosis]|nr:Uncharacterised protein [Mycobacterium tuberculosis]COW50872.1 Uncharacterised protein [Mycobacterium tuberculosis]